MRRSIPIAACAIIMSLVPMFGQGITLAGAGYSDPSVIRVAPGQITTLFVTGLKTVLSSQPVNATSIPLPTTLAGITVTLNQTPLPLLSIQQMSVCNAVPPVPPPPPSSPPSSSLPSPDCLITAITLQIPYDLPLPGENKTTATELAVNENGTVSKAFGVLPITDNFHVLNTCDAFLFLPTNRISGCNAVVTHGDGTVVTLDSPAKAGEVVVI